MAKKDTEEVVQLASEILSSLVSVDIMRCKDCKYLEKWRTLERDGQISHLYLCRKYVISNPSLDDYCSKAEKREEVSNET